MLQEDAVGTSAPIAKPAKKERDIARVYRQVNEAWGRPVSELGPVPDNIAKRVVQCLDRLIMDESRVLSITIKHRGRSHVHGRSVVVNTMRGWWPMIHDLAHGYHRIKNVGARPHDPKQALIERAMIEEVVARGWLEQKPAKVKEPAEPEAMPEAMPEPSKPIEGTQAIDSKRALQLKRQMSVLKRIEQWERKLRRADNAIRRLKKQARYYERALKQ